VTAKSLVGGILYVIPMYPPVGSQPFVVNEMVEVARNGRPLVILGLRPNPSEPLRHGTFAALEPTRVLPARLVDPATLALALVATLRWPGRVARVLAGLHRAAGANPWAQLRLLAVTPKALAAAWRLRRTGVTHVHAHFASTTADCAAIVAGTLAVPFSFTAHAYDIYSTTPRLRNDTLAWKVGHAARVIAVSAFGAELLRAFLPGEERGRVRTVHVGIPLELFQLSPWPPDEGKLRLLCVARWCEKKGLDTLLDACALLRDRGVAFELRLFGDGPLRDALTAQWRRLDLARWVTLGGPIAQEEVAREMRSCHVFVLPCRRDRSGDMDGIPTVFMEAMATGRPVVSCGISGIAELVRPEETGLLAAPDDAGGIADALTRLGTDRALARRLGAQGRTLVEEQHDQRRCARAMLAVLAEAR
jgi:colanic acid/amylovoran biosynthesis glycosyltransferase